VSGAAGFGVPGCDAIFTVADPAETGFSMEKAGKVLDEKKRD